MTLSARHLFPSIALLVALLVNGGDALAFFAPVSERGDRHFEGERYLALKNIKVYESPSEDSLIVDDIPRWRMVYAMPSGDPRWVKVTGAGSSTYPQPFRGLAGASKLDLVDGKLKKPPAIDRDKYFPHLGYVPTDELGSMERGIENFKVDGIKLPSLWASLGVEERRFIPKSKDTPPFTSVLQLLWPSKDGTMSPFCSAFFVEGNLLIGSAGHCFYALEHEPIPMKEAMSNIRALAAQGRIFGRTVGPEGEDIFPVELLGGENSVYKNLLAIGSIQWSKDWALLRARRQPKIPPKYLSLPSSGSWMRKGVQQIMSIGYGADVNGVKIKEFGLNSPHGDICSIPTSVLKVYKHAEDDHSMQAFVRDADCVTVQGDSGGPLVFYNSDSKRFELLGILSWGDREYFDKLTEKAQTAYTDNAARVENIYGKTPLPDNPPGAAAVRRFVQSSTGMYAEKSVWMLDQAFLAAVYKNLGGKSELASRTFESLQYQDVGIQSGYNSLAAPEYSNDNDFIDKSHSKLRIMLSYEMENIKSLLDPKYQQKKTLFEILKPEDLAKSSIPHEAFRWNGEYGFLRERNHTVNWKEKNAISENSQLIVVGGDMFWVNLKTFQITALMRNFMNIHSNNIERTRIFRTYDARIEKEPTQRRTSRTPPTPVPAELKNSIAKDEVTPVAVEGIDTMQPGDLWRQMLKSKMTKERLFILSAHNLRFTIPESIDFGFAAAGGSLADQTQERLEAKLKEMKVGKSDRVVTYCVNASCWLSFNLAVRLRALGYTNVGWLRSGYWGWVQDDLPIGTVAN